MDVRSLAQTGAAYSRRHSPPLSRVAEGREEKGRTLSGASRQLPRQRHALSVIAARCQLPQRGSLWRAGQLSPEQAKHDVSETVVLRCLGQQQLDKECLSRSRCPRKQGPPFCALSGLGRPVESDPACQWLPLWGSWRAKARLRGLFCKNPLQTSPRCGIIHLAASPLRIEYLPL